MILGKLIFYTLLDSPEAADIAAACGNTEATEADCSCRSKPQTVGFDRASADWVSVISAFSGFHLQLCRDARPFAAEAPQ